MNTTPEEIRGVIQMARPNLRLSSITQYEANLKKIRRLADSETYDFLKKPKEVEGLMKDLHYTTQRNILNAIIVFLLAIDKEHEMEDIIKAYSDTRDALNERYVEENKSGVISDKQKPNFASVSEIDEMLGKLKDEVAPFKKKDRLTQKEISQLRAYVIFSMLQKLPPTRNDMAGMKVINQSTYKKLTQEDKETRNYLVNQPKNMRFVYNVYKTSAHYGENIVEVPDDLKPILRMYMRLMGIKNGDVMFEMTRNAVSQLLTKQSQRLIGKKISSTMMRKIYLSSKYADVNKEKEKDAKGMMHAQVTADLIYAKKTS